MRKYIEIGDGDRDFLQRVFNVSDRTLRTALNYSGPFCNTDLAKKIRHTAMLRGGKVYVTLPEEEVMHDTGDGHLHCRVGQSLLDFDTVHGCCVSSDGRRYDDVRLVDIPAIKSEANGASKERQTVDV